MSIVEVTSMSTKGQVVIPASMRRKLNIRGGSKMIVLQEGENILLKPISNPKLNEFETILQLADELSQELELHPSDIDKVIEETRRSHADRT